MAIESRVQADVPKHTSSDPMIFWGALAWREAAQPRDWRDTNSGRRSQRHNPFRREEAWRTAQPEEPCARTGRGPRNRTGIFAGTAVARAGGIHRQSRRIRRQARCGPDRSEVNAELVELDELLERADFVSCHLPDTRDTTGLLDSKRFAKMKPTAYFINTSRGEVVLEEALLQALKSGVIAGAVLDVRTKEPPGLSELESLSHVILTPHIAAFTHEAQNRVTRAICDDVARVLEGKRPQNPVNRVEPKQRNTAQ